MFPALMAVSFALFGIAIVALTVGAGAPKTPAAPEDKPESDDAGLGAQVESVINERVAQLDEKLVDLHTRTAAHLKADLDDAEERLRELERDVAARLETAAEGAGGAVPSTADIPDLKHIMRERMEQFDAKIIDMHNRIANRIQQAAEETEEKIRALEKGGAGGANTEELKKIILGELEKFDKRITALQAGGGEAGSDLAERLTRLEGQVGAISGEESGGVSGEVAARLTRLEEQVGVLAERGASAEGGGSATAAELSDVERIVKERLEQFDEKIIDMHTRVAQRLEQVAEETEEKIRAQGNAAPGGVGPEVMEKIRELEEKIQNLPADASGPGSREPDWEGTGLDPEKLMKERLEQFDAKLIDMHTLAAKRLGDVTDEMEKKIKEIGEGAEKDIADRVTELEAQVRTLLDMVNKGD
ncbi:MAG: hypothetical protein GXP25_13860 [Planctomycetes bacterium]|nr:hypothetical protein [Planctomycetota bacterium]